MSMCTFKRENLPQVIQSAVYLYVRISLKKKDSELISSLLGNSEVVSLDMIYVHSFILIVQNVCPFEKKKKISHLKCQRT